MFFVYLMYIYVRAYLQNITGCAYALYSTKYFLSHIFVIIGLSCHVCIWGYRDLNNVFLGDEDSHWTLDGSVVPLPAIIQMFLYPVSPSGLVYCALASTIPHVYIRPRCPLNCIPPPYLSYNNCPLLLLLAPLAIPCPPPQIHRHLKITAQPPQPSEDFHIFKSGYSSRTCTKDVHW